MAEIWHNIKTYSNICKAFTQRRPEVFTVWFQRAEWGYWPEVDTFWGKERDTIFGKDSWKRQKFMLQILRQRVG